MSKIIAKPGAAYDVLRATSAAGKRKCRLTLAGRRLKLTAPRAEATEPFQNQRISQKSQKSRMSGCRSASILATA